MGVESVTPEQVTQEPEDWRETESQDIPWRTVVLAGLGLLLLVSGIRRRSIPGGVMALTGSLLLYRAAGARNARSQSAEATGAAVSKGSITVGKSPDELSSFVQNPSNLGKAMSTFVDVKAGGPDQLRFSVEPPVGPTIRWRMTLVEERPGELLRWSTDDNRAMIPEMSMHFRPAPGDRGTELAMEVTLDPPGGRYGSAVLQRLDVVPDSVVGVVLDRLKSLAETGEIPTTEGNPSGRGRGDYL